MPDTNFPVKLMLMIIVAIVTGGIGVALILGALQFFKKQAAASVGVKRDKLKKEIDSITAEITELLKYTNSFVSQGQFKTISGKLGGVKDALDKEKGNLVQLEQRLGKAQENVEHKEGIQQELKTSKEEDEIKLEELLGNYQQISDEAISLEQQLAESMRNLDQILSSTPLSDEQKAILTELSEALAASGKVLRTLITEYQTVNERLELLKEQHADLEEEYTKLVEQQLGE